MCAYVETVMFRAIKSHGSFVILLLILSQQCHSRKVPLGFRHNSNARLRNATEFRLAVSRSHRFSSHHVKSRSADSN